MNQFMSTIMKSYQNIRLPLYFILTILVVIGIHVVYSDDMTGYNITGNTSTVISFELTLVPSLSPTISDNTVRPSRAWIEPSSIYPSLQTPTLIRLNTTTNFPTIPVDDLSDPPTLPPVISYPTTQVPSIEPTMNPSTLPTYPPRDPTIYPIFIPTSQPSSSSSSTLSTIPTTLPTVVPTQYPFLIRSMQPTNRNATLSTNAMESNKSGKDKLRILMVVTFSFSCAIIIFGMATLYKHFFIPNNDLLEGKSRRNYRHKLAGRRRKDNSCSSVISSRNSSSCDDDSSNNESQDSSDSEGSKSSKDTFFHATKSRSVDNGWNTRRRIFDDYWQIHFGDEDTDDQPKISFLDSNTQSRLSNQNISNTANQVYFPTESSIPFGRYSNRSNSSHHSNNFMNTRPVPRQVIFPTKSLKQMEINKNKGNGNNHKIIDFSNNHNNNDDDIFSISL